MAARGVPSHGTRASGYVWQIERFVSGIFNGRPTIRSVILHFAAIWQRPILDLYSENEKNDETEKLLQAPKKGDANHGPS